VFGSRYFIERLEADQNIH